jgi:hypothetical protein
MPLVTLLLVVVAVEIVVLVELVVPTMDLLLFQVVHTAEQVMELLLLRVVQMHMDVLHQLAKDQDLVAVAVDGIQGDSVVDKVVQVSLYFVIKSEKLIQEMQKQLVVPLVTIIIRPFMSSTTLAPSQHLLH